MRLEDIPKIPKGHECIRVEILYKDGKCLNLEMLYLTTTSDVKASPGSPSILAFRSIGDSIYTDPVIINLKDIKRFSHITELVHSYNKARSV